MKTSTEIQFIGCNADEILYEHISNVGLQWLKMKRSILFLPMAADQAIRVSFRATDQHSDLQPFIQCELEVSTGNWVWKSKADHRTLKFAFEKALFDMRLVSSLPEPIAIERKAG